MKIVGKVVRDYYDSCSAYGVDETQVLVRNPEKVVLGDYCWLRYGDTPTLTNICYDHSYGQPCISKSRSLLFFCGEAYNIYVKTVGYDVTIAVTGSGQPSKEFQEKALFGEHIDNYTIPDNIKTQLKEYAHQLKCPYFILTVEARQVVLKTWPVLSDINFQKIVDPFTAYQEVQAYMFGVLGGNEKQIVEISDKSKLTKHGFDVKSSFRKQKGEKK